MFHNKHFLAGALVFVFAGPVLAQNSGALATLTNPDVQIQLNLTNQQVQQLAAIMQQTQGQLDQLNGLAQNNRLEARQRYRTLYRYTLQEAMRTLNPAQRRLFYQMTGQGGPQFNPAIGSPTR